MSDRRPVNQLPVYLSPSDVHLMLSICQNDRDRMLINLLWHTGARVTEAINARAGDLTKHGIRLKNLKQGYWRKKADGVKEHVAVPTEKHVFLPAGFLAELHQYCAGKQSQDVIIGRLDNGKPIGRKMAWLIVTRLASEAGIFRRRFSDGSLRPAWTHTLRHSNAVNLLEHGIPITVVKDQLGHSSLGSTQVYTKISDPRKEELIAGVTF